jgi:hypothetical protein
MFIFIAPRACTCLSTYLSCVYRRASWLRPTFSLVNSPYFLVYQRNSLLSWLLSSARFWYTGAVALFQKNPSRTASWYPASILNAANKPGYLFAMAYSYCSACNATAASATVPVFTTSLACASCVNQPNTDKSMSGVFAVQFEFDRIAQLLQAAFPNSDDRVVIIVDARDASKLCTSASA